MTDDGALRRARGTRGVLYERDRIREILGICHDARIPASQASVARHRTPGGATTSKVERDSDVVSASGRRNPGRSYELYQTSFACSRDLADMRELGSHLREAPQEGRHEIDPRREQEHRPIADGALPLERSGDDGRSPRKLGVAQLDDGTRHVARG